VKKFKVTVDGKVFDVEVEELNQNTGTESSVPNKIPAENPAVKTTAAKTVTGGKITDKPPKQDNVQTAEGDLIVKAPMPGSVLDVKVKAGDMVSSGDVLIVLEAMKMENELTAPQDGSIQEVYVKQGDTVNSGDPLVAFS